MNKLRKKILLALGLIPMMMSVDAAVSSDSIDETELRSSVESSQWSKSRFSAAAKTGSRSSGSVDMMLPFMGDDDFMVYTNLQANISTGINSNYGTALEGNLGLGVRRVNDNETAIYGAYAYFDYLKSVHNNTFQQVTVGVERLGLTWDFRANAYLPMGQDEYYKNIDGETFIDKHDVIGQYNTQFEKALAGGDVEVGRTLGSYKLRGYASVYSFGKDITGPKLRLEYRLTDHISFSGSVQYDKKRDTQFLFGVRYSIGGTIAKDPKSIHSRLTDLVVKNDNITTIEHSEMLTNIAYDKLWMVDADSQQNGDGTVDSPYNNIEDAIKSAPKDAIIFIKGQEQTTNQLKDTVALKNGQTLWSGDKSLYWDFTSSSLSLQQSNNALLVQAGQGKRQSISGSITAANNVNIVGIDLQATAVNQDAVGLLIDNKQNISLFDTTINGYAIGLNMLGNSSVTINNTTFDSNNIGINLEGDSTINGEIKITHSNIGLNINGGVSTINANVNITEGSTGINIENAANVVFHNDVITKQLSETGTVIKDNSTASFTHYISRDNKNGLHVSNANVSVHSGIFADNSNLGILIDGTTDTASAEQYAQTFTDVTIANNQQGGVQHSTGDLTFVNSVIDNNDKFGLKLLSDKVTLVDVNVINNKDYGLWITGGNLQASAVMVTGNSANLDHGDANMFERAAIRIDGGEATLDSYSEIKDNFYDGIWINGGTVTAKDILLENNRYGISMTQGTLNLDNANVIKNHGSGILIREAPSASPAVVNITNSNLSYNLNFQGDKPFFSGNGAGLAIQHETAIVTLHNTNLTYNTGSGIIIAGGTLMVTADTLGDSLITHNGVAGILGVKNIFNAKSMLKTIQLENISVTNNAQFGIYAIGREGDVYTSTGSIFTTNPSGNLMTKGTKEGDFANM